MKNKFTLVICALSMICFVVNYFLLSEIKFFWPASKNIFFDFGGQWALCAYTLRGFDPYSLIGITPPLIEEIGIIPLNWSTTPWGLILGNFFYPGFLSLSEAKIYFLVLNFVFLITTAFIVSKKLKCSLGNLTIFFVTLTAFVAGFFISTYFGNAGAVMCCLLILSCLYADERPITAGVMLAFAMVKPQIALPICFALLLRKNFKVLFVAATVDIVAWGIATLMTHKMPLTLLKESFSGDPGGFVVFSGLFTLLFPDNKSFTMLTSMIAGVVFIFLTQRVGLKDDKYFWACPACLATTFFGYSHHNEFFILLLPALACLHLANNKAIFREKIFWLESMFFMASAPYIIYLLFRFYSYNLVESFWLTRTIFAAVLILIGFLMTKNFSKVGSSA